MGQTPDSGQPCRIWIAAKGLIKTGLWGEKPAQFILMHGQSTLNRLCNISSRFIAKGTFDQGCARRPGANILFNIHGKMINPSLHAVPEWDSKTGFPRRLKLPILPRSTGILHKTVAQKRNSVQHETFLVSSRHGPERICCFPAATDKKRYAGAGGGGPDSQSRVVLGRQFIWRKSISVIDILHSFPN